MPLKDSNTENWDLIVKVTELQRKLIAKPVSYTKYQYSTLNTNSTLITARIYAEFHALIWKEWAPETWDGDIGMDMLENFGITRFS